jgi:low temperature requirement protein LtrA
MGMRAYFRRGRQTGLVGRLYRDLVFVLAIGQIAHLIVGEPDIASVWIALGLFVVLWWT